MGNEYTPVPVDTSDVILPEDLNRLTELLAENVHDVWSERKIDEGWTYGDQRDDNLKKHPSLVPYDCLPESEKDYDRRTSQKTLKLILVNIKK